MTHVDPGCIGILSKCDCGISPRAGKLPFSDGLMDEAAAAHYAVRRLTHALSAVLTLLLAALQLSFGPATSQVCARLENVACGP